MAEKATFFFEAEFLRKLERLSLLSRRVFTGQVKGEKKSPRRGTSVEFADYRNYVPGDDLRYLDWNIYGRLDRLLLKLFVEEEDLRVYLLLDRSRSMDFGAPTKFDYARRVAAALAYLALVGLDRVAVRAFAETLEPGLPLLRGRGNVWPVFEYLSRLQPGGETRLSEALTRQAQETKRPGLCILLSDFLDPQGYQRGLDALVGRGFEVVVIQVLDAEELQPSLVGDLKLVDAESGEEREITVSESLLRAYRRNVEEFCAELQTYCHGRGLTYLRTTTAQPFEILVLTTLRRRGVVGG
ncbi:MAG TPA: DUF58 domain-containing protein [Armatimonadetes bacterium]|nr:DUF58 domain-containing protein [Armatimonadota bacterium]